jgi:hypothetical protein
MLYAAPSLGAPMSQWPSRGPAVTPSRMSRCTVTSAFHVPVSAGTTAHARARHRESVTMARGPPAARRRVAGVTRDSPALGLRRTLAHPAASPGRD